MEWYEVLLPAVAVNLAIRLDSLVIGPYWAFSEVIAGMGGTDVDFWYSKQTVRFSIFRRFFYVAAMGAALDLYYGGVSGRDAALIGAISAGLLLWPIVFHGLPLGVAKNDWQLIPLYVSVIGGFISSALFGQYAVDFIREQSGGDLVGWARDEALKWAISFILVLAFTAFFQGSYSSLRERKRRREARGYERP
jgi:hypothetical protein